MSVSDDFKAGKGAVLGVIAIATTVGAFLINAFGFPAQSTIAIVALVTMVMVCSSWLVDRAEKRQAKALEDHINKDNVILQKLLKLAEQGQLSDLRTEMNRAIDHTPADHHSILKCAEKYFLELKGDWVETDIFIKWIRDEEKAGRTVHVPPALVETLKVAKKREAENSNQDSEM